MRLRDASNMQMLAMDMEDVPMPAAAKQRRTVVCVSGAPLQLCALHSSKRCDACSMPARQRQASQTPHDLLTMQASAPAPKPSCRPRWPRWAPRTAATSCAARRATLYAGACWTRLAAPSTAWPWNGAHGRSGPAMQLCRAAACDGMQRQTSHAAGMAVGP